MYRKSRSGNIFKVKTINPADDAFKRLKLDELLQNERWLIKFRIVLKQHKSIVLHCINTQIINISKLFYADSNGGIFVVLRCVNPELCCGKSHRTNSFDISTVSPERLKGTSFLRKSESEWPGCTVVPPITEGDPDVRQWNRYSRYSCD